MINAKRSCGSLFAAASWLDERTQKHIILAGGIFTALTNQHNQTQNKIAAGKFTKEVTTEPNKEFPGTRELLQSINLSNGDTCNIYMPNTQDMNSLDLKSPYFHVLIGAKSVNMTYEKFLDLPMIDSNKILEILGKSIQILGHKKQ